PRLLKAVSDLSGKPRNRAKFDLFWDFEAFILLSELQKINIPLNVALVLDLNLDLLGNPGVRDRFSRNQTELDQVTEIHFGTTKKCFASCFVFDRYEVFIFKPRDHLFIGKDRLRSNGFTCALNGFFFQLNLLKSGVFQESKAPALLAQAQ